MSISVFYQTIVLALALALGYLVVRMPLIRRSFLPTGLGAGIVLLVLGPQVMGDFSPNLSLPAEFYESWSKLPKHLINVVFACLFLARPIISVKRMWEVAGPQIAFGQMLAWGQYAIGGLITLLILIPFFGMPGVTGALIEISFEGGHGTVAGMTPVFNELGFETGKELAVGLATASLLTALISGITLINWAARKGHFKRESEVKIRRNEVYYHRIIREIRSKGVSLSKHITAWKLITHTFLTGAGVFFGWLINRSLALIEVSIRGDADDLIMNYLPLFTFCMFGGMIAQLIWTKLGFKVSRQIVELISAVSLGVLIMTAVGTMSLDFILNDGFVFIILYATGVLWILLSFIILARRMFRNYWFENAIVSMGQSMGMTATGLLFAEMVDRKNKTGAVEAFGYKQLLFEPLMGGGMVTALSMPIILILGLPVFTAICLTITIGWMILGLRKFGRE
jgi:glutamate:Na+ symporter, ESS family